ncbi:MAG: hypothetical protein IPK53_07325 [bacterium]|nr:hypothetical protein [bacterium]
MLALSGGCWIFSAHRKENGGPIDILTVWMTSDAGGKAGAALWRDGGEKLPAVLPAVWGGGHQLKQVFLNLILNAAEALPRRRRFNQLRPVMKMKSCKLTLPIRSRCGPGLLAHLFEPFFTTKDAGSGAEQVGLQSRGIVANHEGTLTVRSTSLSGATFTVALPSSCNTTGGAIWEDKRLPTSSVWAFPGKILLVDDETNIREGLRRRFAQGWS